MAVTFRRKRTGKTNYHRRLTYLVSKKPRAVIRKSMRYIIVQIIEYKPDGDKTHIMVNSRTLSKLGWDYNKKNIPSAYLVGLMAGVAAKEKGIKEAIVDFGMQSKAIGGSLFAVVKGLVDAGVSVPHDKKCFPDDDRLKGTHISGYSDSIKSDSEKYRKQFSGYSKNKADPGKITENFETIKKKILGS